MPSTTEVLSAGKKYAQKMLALIERDPQIAALQGQLEADGFQWLELREPHFLQVGRLPTHEDHKDPFDRLLAAQSLSEPLILLTADAKLARYGSTVRVV